MISAPTLSADPEAPHDDTPPEVALSAALNVWGAELVACSGQVTEQFTRDGRIDRWLLAGIERTVARLGDALATFKQERRDV